jgi:predicted LPLAT superfamily acyltransferase
VCPDVGFLKRQRLVLKHLYTFAQTLLDRAYQQLVPFFETHRQGIENILTPAEQSQGLILLSAHVGSWEIAANCLKSDGLSKPFNMVRYDSESKVQESQSLLQIREYLNRGLPVGIMGDRPVGSHFELVSFFGRLAPFDSTPFRVAAICEAPLLFTFGFKGKGARYEFSATPSKYYRFEEGRDRGTQLVEWTQEFAKQLEGVLRSYPDQWFNFFRFWSVAPIPPGGLRATQSPQHSKVESDKLVPMELPSAPDSTPIAEELFQL